MEDAWFNLRTSSHRSTALHGAWNEHRIVLERLGSPACHPTRPLVARDETDRRHPLARDQFLVDALHLSRWG